uniref:Tail fiber assembly protein n=1 Tax=Klebsiella phage vB_Kpn1-P3 TaxID=3230838 RepID=A0AAU8EEG5_9VIRU
MATYTVRIRNTETGIMLETEYQTELQAITAVNTAAQLVAVGAPETIVGEIVASEPNPEWTLR